MLGSPATKTRLAESGTRIVVSGTIRSGQTRIPSRLEETYRRRVVGLLMFRFPTLKLQLASHVEVLWIKLLVDG